MKDLSKTVSPGTAFNAGESMSAGNTVTTDTGIDAMAAPGSEPVNPPPTKGGFETDTPQMQVPAVKDYAHKVADSPSSVPSSPAKWKKAGE